MNIRNFCKRFWASFLAFCIIAGGIVLPGSVQAAQNAVVRVLLTRLGLTDQATIALDGSYTVGDMSFQRGSKLVISCATGSLMLYYEGMAVSLGRETRLIRHAIDSDQENGLRINGGYDLYCGDLALKTDGKMMTAVLYIPVEEYLLGVVPYEMSDSFPLEALKAQAVAARTYALRRIGASGDYDVVDNTNDQVYRGYNKLNDNAARAVRETEGICGYDRNALGNCYYTASNGGQVELPRNVWGKEDGDYITMHADPYDVENPESPVKRATILKAPENGVIGNQAFTDAVKLLMTEPLAALGYTGEAKDIRILSVNAAEMQKPKNGKESLVMTRLRLTLSVEALRYATPEPDEEEMSIFQIGGVTATPTAASSATPAVTAAPPPTASPKPVYVRVPQAITVDVPVFACVKPLLSLGINGTDNEIVTVEEKKNSFEIAARRYGHGVGMSQRGAQWMAKQYHWTYDQILRFYYPGLAFRKTETRVILAPALSAQYLATPGPAASPTPRPTLMPVTQTLQPGEWLATVSLIGQNSYLNLRAQPSTDSDVLRQLYYGQQLIVTEKLNDDWLKVKTDGAEGYVMAQFVEKAEEKK